MKEQNPKDFCVIFSERFRKMRELKDLTQGELAEEIGISRQSVNAIEKGKSLPSIELAREIADFFNTSIDAFLRFDEEMEKHFFSKGENMQEISPFRPFRESLSLREAMDRLLEDSVVAGESLPAIKTGAVPAVEMYDTEKEVIAKMNVPGFAEEDIAVEVDDKAIYITGERKQQDKVEKKNYFHQEISYGKFSRVLAIPAKVRSEKAKAEFDKGVLIITIPKIEEKKSKTVKLKISSKK